MNLYCAECGEVEDYDERQHVCWACEYRTGYLAVAKAEKYLEIIKQENDAPGYRWNKESHGVLGFLKWLNKTTPKESKDE